MNGNIRPMMAPDPAAMAAQSKVIDAQKELSAIQYSQAARTTKAQNAINFILLPFQGPDGLKRQEPDDTPECKSARAAAYTFLEKYFSTETDFEAGIPVREWSETAFATA